MTSGPGTTKTDVPPDEAIEEISGLLEMDELKAGESRADTSDESEINVARASAAVGDGLDVSMETPAPASLDSYLPPPPVSDEPQPGDSEESQSGSSTNMAYEDLLEKLVLPANPAQDEPPSEITPPVAPARADLYPPRDSVTPGLASSDERTVVTMNPLLAEEQEAAARGAESYILPAAAAPLPSFATPPVVRQPSRETATIRVVSSKTITLTYPIFGVMILAAALMGGVLARLMAPARVVVTQAPTLVGQPVVPAQVTPPANSAPKVVPLPAATESPSPAQAAARPGAGAQPAQEAPAAAEVPAAAEEPIAGEVKPAKLKVHKAPRPAKSVASKPASPSKPAAKPTATKPAKKPTKGWTDPFAQ